MVREAVQNDLDAILELYLFLHEDSIPEKDERLRGTWTQIMQDPNHHLIVNEVDGKIISSYEKGATTAVIRQHLYSGLE